MSVYAEPPLLYAVFASLLVDLKYLVKYVPRCTLVWPRSIMKHVYMYLLCMQNIHVPGTNSISTLIAKPQ